MKTEAQRIQEVQELIDYCVAQFKEIDAIPERDRDYNDVEWRDIFRDWIREFEQLMTNPAKLVNWSEERDRLSEMSNPPRAPMLMGKLTPHVTMTDEYRAEYAAILAKD
jgi:hypothetical protein